MKQVITDTLVNQYGVSLPSFLAFERICGLGTVLLVLDGFDEMAGRSDRQALLECFQQIYLLAALNTKILLTCRSNFFRSTLDIVALFRHYSISVPISDQPGSAAVRLDLSTHGRIINVEKLSPDQVLEFIRKRFGEQSDDVFQTIRKIHDLSDLATRPVLLDMILTTLPELRQEQIRVNSAALYEHYTDKWSARDQWRISTPLVVRQQFSDTLAWAMHRYGLAEIKYSFLREVMMLSIGTVASSENELEHFANDIQTCSFLIRSGTNDTFRFAHKSFLEFLVAKRLVSDILRGTLSDKPAVEDPSWRWGLFMDPQEVVGSRFVSFPDLLFHTSQDLFRGRSRLYSARSALRGVLIAQEAARGVAKSLPGAAHASIVASIEDSILALFAQKSTPAIEEIGLSEEIATFALEDLENRGVSIPELTSHLKDNALRGIFAEILRLSKSVSFIDRNRSFFKEHATTTDDRVLRSVFCAALARVPGAIDDDFVQFVRKRMAADEWTYFLFEIGRNSDANRPVLESVLGDRELRPVDRVLCAWGLGILDKGASRRTPDGIGGPESAEIVEALLKSDDKKEVELGITLCGFVDISESKLAEIMFELIDRSTDRAVKVRGIEQLGLLSTEQAWKRIRAVAAQGRHPDVRREFELAEKRIRDNISSMRNRRSWDDVKSDRRLRENMWRLLR